MAWNGAFVAMAARGLRITRRPLAAPSPRPGVTAGDLITDLDVRALKGLSLPMSWPAARRADTTIKDKIFRKGPDAQVVDLIFVRASRRINAVNFGFAVEQGRTVAEGDGAWPILEFEEFKATPLVRHQSRIYRTTKITPGRFRQMTQESLWLILNPGPWTKAAMIGAGPP